MRVCVCAAVLVPNRLFIASSASTTPRIIAFVDYSLLNSNHLYNYIPSLTGIPLTLLLFFLLQESLSIIIQVAIEIERTYVAALTMLLKWTNIYIL